jgi:hypothetical protein
MKFETINKKIEKFCEVLDIDMPNWVVKNRDLEVERIIRIVGDNGVIQIENYEYDDPKEKPFTALWYIHISETNPEGKIIMNVSNHRLMKTWNQTIETFCRNENIALLIL